MPGWTDTTETEILNHYFRTATASKPTNEYIALWIGDPTDPASGGAEVTTTGTAYARQAVSVADASWSAPADDGSGSQFIQNTNAIVYADATANYGTVTHFAVMSASTGGTMRASGALTTPRTINNGDLAPTFAAGALVIKQS